ncbi:MAG: STAS/SEC14 domain-containing protein [Lentisphaeraceae bacterium]|nr:STAS/SEC14 domain-containing protein [Lentisphaeraceae bacterium]
MGKIEHLFLEDENFVLTVAEGEISDDKFMKHIAILNESEKLQSNYRGIVDCRNVSTVATPSSDSIFKAGHFEGGSEKPRKVAVLSNNELIFGLVRMYDAYTPHAEMEVFSELSRAIEWLEVQGLYEQIRDFYRSLDSKKN